MAKDEQPDRFGRRAFVLKALDKSLLPVTITVVGGWGLVLLNQRYKERRNVSISIIRSDSAATSNEVSSAPFLNPFEAPAEPTPDPNPRYTYTTLVRNNGDFPEEHVTIAIAYENEDEPATLIAGPELDSSSRLLAQTIQAVEPLDPPPSYAMSLPRMNPGEWVSFKTSWTEKLRVNVEVRSDTTFDSAG